MRCQVRIRVLEEQDAMGAHAVSEDATHLRRPELALALAVRQDRVENLLQHPPYFGVRLQRAIATRVLLAIQQRHEVIDETLLECSHPSLAPALRAVPV